MHLRRTAAPPTLGVADRLVRRAVRGARRRRLCRDPAAGEQRRQRAAAERLGDEPQDRSTGRSGTSSSRSAPSARASSRTARSARTRSTRTRSRPASPGTCAATGRRSAAIDSSGSVACVPAAPQEFGASSRRRARSPADHDPDPDRKRDAARAARRILVFADRVRDGDAGGLGDRSVGAGELHAGAGWHRQPADRDRDDARHDGQQRLAGDPDHGPDGLGERDATTASVSCTESHASGNAPTVSRLGDDLRDSDREQHRRPHAACRPRAPPARGQYAELMSTANMHTTHGTIALELFDDDAPKTVANFRKLAERELLRRDHLPPRDPGLHDPGRLPAGHRHRRSRLHVRGRVQPAQGRPRARSRWRTPGRTRTARSSSS